LYQSFVQNHFALTINSYSLLVISVDNQALNELNLPTLLDNIFQMSAEMYCRTLFGGTLTSKLKNV